MRKAQAAMEFLMTYGWALLAVLAAIGALAYFGVLSPQRTLPEICLFQQGLACQDFKVTSSTTEIFIQNGYGRDIEMRQLTVGSCSQSLNNQTLDNGDATLITMSCSNGGSGTTLRLKGSLEFRFLDSQIVKENQLQLVARVP